MFYNQIIIQQGLPFDVKLHGRVVDETRLSKAEFDKNLEKGYADMKNGRVAPAAVFFSDIKKKYHL